MFENDHSFLMYIFLYLSVMISIFLSLFWLRSRSTFFLLKNYYNFFNLITTNKHFVYCVCFFFFCLMGLPPLMFFLGKFYLLYSLFHSETYIIILFLLLCTCINITYYLRVIKIVSLMQNEDCLFLFDISRRDAIIISFLLLLMIIIIFIPTPFFFIFFKILLK
jgi:NADH:ubiquinone oxidoreductase subunit 2 (subunit N)